MNAHGDKSDASVGLMTAAPPEAAAISVMAARIWPVAYGPILTHGQIAYMLEWMYAPERVRRDMDEDGIVYFWIVRGMEKLGFLAFGPIGAGMTCPLHKCYLLTEEQGRGSGSRAMGVLVEHLRSLEVPSVELRVNRNNTPAIAFYQKNGFTIFAEDCLEIGGGYVMDDYLMMLKISP